MTTTTMAGLKSAKENNLIDQGPEICVQERGSPRDMEPSLQRISCKFGRKIPRAVTKKLFTLESGLVGMFVQGAPAYINENINPSMGLANGAFVVLYSLSFGGDVSAREVGDIRRQLEHAKPGGKGPPGFPSSIRQRLGPPVPISCKALAT